VGRGVSVGVDMVERWEIVVDLEIVECEVCFELNVQGWCECVVGRSILESVEYLYARRWGLCLRVGLQGKVARRWVVCLLDRSFQYLFCLLANLTSSNVDVKYLGNKTGDRVTVVV
jgi:hypothetical protein